MIKTCKDCWHCMKCARTTWAKADKRTKDYFKCGKNGKEVKLHYRCPEVEKPVQQEKGVEVIFVE